MVITSVPKVIEFQAIIDSCRMNELYLEIHVK